MYEDREDNDGKIGTVSVLLIFIGIYLMMQGTLRKRTDHLFVIFVGAILAILFEVALAFTVYAHFTNPEVERGWLVIAGVLFGCWVLLVLGSKTTASWYQKPKADNDPDNDSDCSGSDEYAQVVRNIEQGKQELRNLNVSDVCQTKLGIPKHLVGEILKHCLKNKCSKRATGHAVMIARKIWDTGDRDIKRIVQMSVAAALKRTN